METIITITRKGQTTLPASVRQKLGLSKEGGILKLSFDESTGEAILTRPLSISELSQHISSYIKPGTTPLLDVDTYYQAKRNQA